MALTLEIVKNRVDEVVEGKQWDIITTVTLKDNGVDVLVEDFKTRHNDSRTIKESMETLKEEVQGVIENYKSKKSFNISDVDAEIIEIKNTIDLEI